jgi:site-specific recombinase XerD
LSGDNIKDVKEMIGHSDISMTDRSSHLTLNNHKTIQEKLAKHYENTTN